MNVYVRPLRKLSIAMQRLSYALAVNAPRGIRIVGDPREADLQVLHVIGTDALEEVRAPRYVAIQYVTNMLAAAEWAPIWRDAALVWSYYDLQAAVEAEGTPFLRLPMGVDGATFKLPAAGARDIGIVTTGYVHGPGAEALEEPAAAAHACGLSTVHVGPSLPEGMGARPPRWTSEFDIPDRRLVELYQQARWVSGLRHAEGFEMPVLEGLCCGARPIVFDRPDAAHWFGDHAVRVPESEGPELVDMLVRRMADAPKPVTQAERAAVLETFDWQAVAARFWAAVRAAVPEPAGAPAERPKPELVRQVAPSAPELPVLLWAGDACVPSGFARVTHAVLETLRHEWDVHVVGLNYNGDPHAYPYRVYPAAGLNPRDVFGVTRVPEMMRLLRPDMMVVLNDPWNVPAYLKQAGGQMPVVGMVAVDGLNCAGLGMNGLRRAVFWTEFGKREAQRGGYTGPASVVPLGVDLDTYAPASAEERAAIRRSTLPVRVRDGFIVGAVGRNQPRKRLDLTLRYFARWVQEDNVPDAYLFCHVAPTGDLGFDVARLADYYGVSNRIIDPQMLVWHGIPEHAMRRTYCLFDVQLTTTQGEGFGLTTLEGMACGVPQVVPDWSGLGDWAKDAAWLVPCTSTAVSAPIGTPMYTIGGVPDEAATVLALRTLYRDEMARRDFAERGLELARQPRFRWSEIGEAFARELRAAREMSWPAQASS